MPRVTDFPDQTATLLQAALQNRSMNIRANQQYLDAAGNAEAAQRSMYSLMMGDTLARDQMALDKELTKEGYELEDKLSARNTAFNYAQLGEQKRSNLVNEDFSQQGIELARDELNHYKQVAQHEQEIDRANQGLNSLGLIQEQFNDVQQIYSQIQGYQKKLNKGVALTGAEMEDMSSLHLSLKAQVAMSKNMINDIAKTTGLQSTTAEALLGSLDIYESDTIRSDWRATQQTNESLANSARTANIQRSEEKGVFGNFITGIFDQWNRIFKDENEVPKQTQNTLRKVTQVLQNDAEWTTDIEKDLNYTLQKFADAGFEVEGGWFVDEDDVSSSKADNYNFMMDKVIGLATRAYLRDQAKTATYGGLTGQDLKQFVESPVNQAMALDHILPKEIKQGMQDMQVLENLQTIQANLGLDAYLTVAQGGRGTQQILQQMGMNLNLANKLDGVKQRIKSGQSKFISAEGHTMAKNLIENLANIGTLQDQSSP